MSESTLQLEPPRYSPSLPSPDYSVKPADGEHLIDHGLGGTPVANSTFIKKFGRTTVVLNEQEEGTTTPTFGRHADISGHLFFEQGHDILDVTLKVEGKLETMISDLGGRTTQVLRISQNLWTHSESRGNLCQDQLSFNIALPETFQYNGESDPLPPSYLVNYLSSPSLFVRASYQLHFITTRALHRKLSSLTKTKHISIPFTYLPRAQSYQPIIHGHVSFHSVHNSPEEWYQAVSCLKMRPNATAGPVHANVFIPRGRVYGIRKVIPFYLQISGKTCSLNQLLSGARLDTPTPADSNTASGRPRQSSADSRLIRVYILRRTTVGESRTRWKNSIISEGVLLPTSQDLCPCCSNGICTDGHVGWEGKLKVVEGTTVGSFSTANVSVKGSSARLHHCKLHI